MTTLKQMFVILLICAAFIDTVLTCGAPTGSDILHQGSCSFTNGSTCGYRFSGHWRVHNGRFTYFFSDEIKDGHNSGDADHHYALLDTSQVNIRTPDILSSPMIMPGSYCLSFWYQISGPFHYFNVTLHKAPTPRLIWKLSDQTKGRWIQVTVNIKTSTPFKIVFQSQLEGFQTVAVDDILLGKQGQYLPSLAGTPNRVTICQGTGTTVSCGSDSIIAVADIQLGTELTTTCGLGNTSIGCCYYDSADCLTAYSGTMPQYQCSGKSICSFGDSISAADMSLCGVANYPVTNDYLTMEYYCLLNSMVLPMCASVSATSTGNLLYLKNNDYPLYIRATETNCTCSVETTSCASNINVYFLHFELDDGGGSCSGAQKIIINDNGTDSVFTCSDNTYYSITKMLTSSSNYLTVSLENTAGVNAGLVFTEYEATESTATLHIDCPAKEQTYCKGSTTGPSTKSTTISTTTNTNTKTITPYKTTQLLTIITQSPTSPITKILTSSKHLTTTPKPTTTEQNLKTATAPSTIPRLRTSATTTSTTISTSKTKIPFTTTPITLPRTKTKTQKASLTPTTKTVLTKTATIPTTNFKTTSNTPVHFHLLPQQAIHTACESDRWNITIDMRIMTSIYPDIQKNDIYLGNYGCKGTMESDMILVFHQGLQNCSTVETKTPHSLKFVNKLVYAQHDPVFTFIIRRHFWDLNVECDVPRDATATAHMHHDGLHLPDSINIPPPTYSSISLVFYRDQTYSQSLTGPPFHISVGETVYGKVFTETQDNDIKLVLRSCYMKPYKEAPEEQSYYIIKNGCVTDKNTHIITYSQHEVRFVFQEIEYTNNKEGLDIYCKASLCGNNDYTSRCDQSCHGPAIIG